MGLDAGPRGLAFFIRFDAGSERGWRFHLESSMHDDIWFASAGTNLYAIEQGRGQPILALHGGLADHRASLAYAGPLAASYRLITPDLRGAGRSKDKGPLRWEQLADDLAALLDHLGIERAVIAGVSAGSGVVVRFGLRHPDRIAGLVILAPLYPGSERELDDAPRAALARMDAYAQRSVREGIQALQPLFEALPDAIRERAQAMLESFDPASVAATTRLLSTTQPFDVLEDLQGIRSPTLVVRGRDPQHPGEIADLYADSLPHARVIEAEVEQIAAAIDGFCRTEANW
jgi:pimeloyl-ACP methyl ester carboxylesterase